MWQEIHKIPASGNVASFNGALQIWIKKPHVINRNLRGAMLLVECDHGDDLATVLVTLNDELARKSDCNAKKIHDCVKMIVEKQIPDADVKKGNLTVYIRDLLPKQIEKHSVLREIVIFDGLVQQAYFFAFESIQPDGTVTDFKDNLGYKVQLHQRDLDTDSHSLSLSFLGDPDSYTAESNLGYSLPWLKHRLLPKLTSWSCEEHLNTEITSLRLVPVDRYNLLYNQLKVKYGIPLVQKWPECTDPQKFVFEDVAIATYLLLLWEDDRQKKGLDKKQSFVDLGCGNGLLVYILEAEGEQTITPSDDTLYPEYDWLIGNHSDELTPWIPVMAARSSHACCYFVLPCCPWDFSAKFSQKSSGVSQYRSYLNFVQEVGGACGFNVEEDTLRIPSTKRVCFIGRSRVYKAEEEADYDKKRQQYINSRCTNRSHSASPSLHGHDDIDTESEGQSVTCSCTSRQKSPDALGEESTDLTASSVTERQNDRGSSSGGNNVVKRKWATDFKARDSVEKPRNCISVSSEVKDRITHAVFKALLDQDDTQQVALPDGNYWNQGGSLPLSDVAVMFDQQTLQQLKCECGGLQTLLRNSHHVFRVQGGKVSLRDWTTDDYDRHQQQKRRRKGKPRCEGEVTQNKKTKLCFFFDHHPQGCPLVTEQCRFAHGEVELREKTLVRACMK